MIARALVALALLLAGMLAILVVGGTAAGVIGLLAIVAALVALDRAVFRIAASSPKRDERPPDPSVR